MKCMVDNCPCEGFTDNKGQVLIVEHEIKGVIGQGKQAYTVFKSKSKKQDELSRSNILNQFLRFNYRTNKWQCLVCNKSGAWVDMRNHEHKGMLPRIYGIKVKQKSIKKKVVARRAKKQRKK